MCVEKSTSRETILNLPVDPFPRDLPICTKTLRDKRQEGAERAIAMENHAELAQFASALADCLVPLQSQPDFASVIV